jgi:hypothetical protein
MKRLLIVLVLMFSTPAAAQPEILRAVSSVVITSLTSTSPITSTAFNPYASTVRVLCTVTCLLAVVSTPIVVGSSVPVYLPANTVEYFKVTPGQHVLVRSGLQAGGQLFLSEMDR